MKYLILSKRSRALFGIGMQDRDYWLGINPTDPKKLEWIEGTNRGEMNWRWRQFIIQPIKINQIL